MTALDYANARENVIVRFAGNGCPAGQDIAWIPPETELPFDLDKVTGQVVVDGDGNEEFVANNLNDGTGARGWQFHDWNGNLIYAIWLREDTEVWQEQYDELNEVN